VGVPAIRAARCVGALHEAGIEAAEIGEIEPMREGQPPIWLT
jgi:hypothetical protein